MNTSPPPPPSGPAPSAPCPVLPAGWTEHNTASGQVYYYNSATGQSMWTRPVGEGDTESKYLEVSALYSRVMLLRVGKLAKAGVLECYTK